MPIPNANSALKKIPTLLVRHLDGSILEYVLRQSRPQKEGTLSIKQINPNYELLLNDGTTQNPFVLSSDIIRTVNELTLHLKDDNDRARAIYSWMEQEIEYDLSQIENSKGIKKSAQILAERKGICADMSFLYVTMARSAGLMSNAVDVERDSENNRVNHLCASVTLQGHVILADVAYHTFDIKHRKYRILTDNEAIEMYRRFAM